MVPIAIAGVAGSADTRRHCLSALDGLDLYGAQPSTVGTDAAHFGTLGPHDATGKDHCPGAFENLFCVIDGRIDNLPELRRTLDVSPALAPSVVAASAWHRWGADTPRRLLGEYALAIFDRRDGRLWMARDPSGYRPLYYRIGKGVIAFATMPSGLLAIERRGPNVARFARYVEGTGLDSVASFWTDIQQVPPGAVVEAVDGRATTRLWLAPSDNIERKGSWESLTLEMRELLDRAVSRNLAGAGPIVGAQLSSGLDSSAVLSTAARQLAPGQSLLAFTAAPEEDARLIVPRGRYPDESGLARQTAAFAGAEHLVVRERAPLLPAIRGVARYFQEPPPAQFSFPWWRRMNESLRERGGRVMLIGGQGNATLSYGGLGALARYLLGGRIRDWWREARMVRHAEEVRVRGIFFNSVYPLVPPPLGNWLFRTSNDIPTARTSYVRSEWRQRDIPGAITPSGYMAERLAMIRNFNAGTRKRGMLALTGIEERDPASDRELMEFTLALPPEAHLKNGRIKPLIREALSDRVPSSVLFNRQRGVCGADWYERIAPADCYEALEEIKASASAAELLDLDSLTRAVNAWPAFDPNRAGFLDDFGRRIARALSTGIFLAETDRYPLGGKARQ